MCCSSSSSGPIFPLPNQWSHCFPVFPLIFVSVFYRTPLDLGSPRYKPASADNATDGNPAGLSNKQDAEPRGENVTENTPDPGRSGTSDDVSPCDSSPCLHGSFFVFWGVFFQTPPNLPLFQLLPAFRLQQSDLISTHCSSRVYCKAELVLNTGML